MLNRKYFKIIDTKTFIKILGGRSVSAFYRLMEKHSEPDAKIKFPPDVFAKTKARQPGYFLGHVYDFKCSLQHGNPPVYEDLPLEILLADAEAAEAE